MSFFVVLTAKTLLPELERLVLEGAAIGKSLRLIDMFVIYDEFIDIFYTMGGCQALESDDHEWFHRIDTQCQDLFAMYSGIINS